jgi:Holliday junction resolvase RusA-like endonuclease
MTQTFTLHEEPMGAPRMTHADAWKKRDCVVRYRAYADRLRHVCKGVDQNATGVSWTAWFAIPPSWSKKKKLLMAGKLHRVKPDRDNIDKGVLDTLFESDQGVATGSIAKFWDDGKGPRIEIIVTAE